MRKTLWAFLALFVGLSPPLNAQEHRRVTLAAAYDLDGEAADADQVAISADLEDSVAATIAANPDACRAVTITVVDTTPSITAGDVDVVGTDCAGDAQTEVVDISSGAGVYTTTALFETVTSATPGATTTVETLGGASDETWSIGTAALTSASDQFCRFVGRNGTSYDFPYNVSTQVSTSGSSTTVTGTGAFTNVSVGDLLFLRAQGTVRQRVVTARASADSITVSSAIDISTAAGFSYFRPSCGSGFHDGEIDVSSTPNWTFQLYVEALAAASGDGLAWRVQCRQADAVTWTTVIPTDGSYQNLDDAAAPSSPAGQNRGFAWDFCRVGMNWSDSADSIGSDDGDSAADSIWIWFEAAS